MRSIIVLSFRKIYRTNRAVLLFLIICYFALFYIALYTRELKSFAINLNLVLSYGCLLLTGGQLKDEISNGYLDVILHRSGRLKVVIGKYLSILSFAFICYIFFILSIFLLSLLLNVNFEESASFLFTVAKGFIVTTYLISLGFFLSLYLKGYFNFAFVFFLQFAFLVLMEYMDILSRLDTPDKISNFSFLFISLISPHLVYSRTNIFALLGLFIFSIIFILSTLYLFKRTEFIKE